MDILPPKVINIRDLIPVIEIITSRPVDTPLTVEFDDCHSNASFVPCSSCRRLFVTMVVWLTRGRS